MATINAADHPTLLDAVKAMGPGDWLYIPPLPKAEYEKPLYFNKNARF